MRARGPATAKAWYPSRVECATAVRSGQISGEEGVPGLRVLVVLPCLGDLAVAQVEHQRFMQVERLTVALARGGMQTDNVLAVADHVVNLGVKGAAGRLGQLSEVGKGRLAP